MTKEYRTKVRNCVPFATPEAGVTETIAVIDFLEKRVEELEAALREACGPLEVRCSESYGEYIVATGTHYDLGEEVSVGIYWIADAPSLAKLLRAQEENPAEADRLEREIKEKDNG